MNVIDLDELRKYLGNGITIRKTYKAAYEYSKNLVGLLIELNGTYSNLFIPISCYHGKYCPGYAHTLLKVNHPFGKRFLFVEDHFLNVFNPIVEGMYI